MCIQPCIRTYSHTHIYMYIYIYIHTHTHWVARTRTMQCHLSAERKWDSLRERRGEKTEDVVYNFTHMNHA